jgi:hypothetical protein
LELPPFTFFAANSMETLLLLALGALVVNRFSNETTTTDTTATPPPQDPPPGQGSGLPVEISRIRLPHIIANGKPVVVLTLPVPAGAVYQMVECKEPGGALRISDIQSKLVNYQTAYDAWVSEGRPTRARKGTKKGKIIKAKQDAQKAYQQAVLLHFSACSNYAKQL